MLSGARTFSAPKPHLSAPSRAENLRCAQVRCLTGAQVRSPLGEHRTAPHFAPVIMK